jgi:hypothetical protein
LEKIIKKKNDEYLNYYTHLENKIEAIILIKNLNKKNIKFTIIKKYNYWFKNDKNSILKICEYINNLINIKSISFWIKNMEDLNNFDLITITISNICYKISKKNNNIYLLIKNGNNLKKININIDKWSLLVINLKTNNIYLNNIKIYQNNDINKNDENNIDNKNNMAECIIYNDDNYIVKNFLDEIILYNNVLCDNDINYLYDIFTKMLDADKLINNDVISDNKKKIDELLKIIEQTDTDIKIGTLKNYEIIKKKIINLLDDKHLTEIKSLEEYSIGIKKCSDIIKLFDSVNNISYEKYYDIILNSLKIIVESYELINNFIISFGTREFIKIDNKLIDISHKINELNSVKYSDVIKYDEINYYIGNKFNFLWKFEESLLYFNYGLPNEFIKIKDKKYLKSHSNKSILIEESIYLEMFELDKHITDNINSITEQIKNDSCSDNFSIVKQNLAFLKNSNKNLESLYESMYKKITDINHNNTNHNNINIVIKQDFLNIKLIR